MVDRITAVLRGHMFYAKTNVCTCGRLGNAAEWAAHVAERVAAEVQPEVDFLHWLLAESLWHEQIRRDQLADAKREMNRRLCDD